MPIIIIIVAAAIAVVIMVESPMRIRFEDVCGPNTEEHERSRVGNDVSRVWQRASIEYTKRQAEWRVEGLLFCHVLYEKVGVGCSKCAA